MRVDILAGAELDVDALRILAAQRFRAAVIVRPFVADHDHRIAMAHLAVREMAVGIEQHEQRLESERLLEPAEGGLAVLIADRARKPLGAMLFGHPVSPANHMISHSSNIFYKMKIYSRKE